MSNQIRKARVDEIREIQKMLAGHAQRGDMLPRSLSELYDNLRDIFVYLDDDTPEIIGTCSMHICWEDLAEIRSLAVREPYQNQGIGRKLVEACISEASALRLHRIFVLTYQVEFFQNIGFQVVDKWTLPLKILAYCLKCVKFPECDENAMIIVI